MFIPSYNQGLGQRPMDQRTYVFKSYLLLLFYILLLLLESSALTFPRNNNSFSIIRLDY